MTHQDRDLSASSTTEGLPVSPSLGPTLEMTQVPPRRTAMDRRVVYICGLAVVLGAIGAGSAALLTALIGLITNLCFYGRVSTDFVAPAGHQLGAWVIAIPVLGAVVVGLMARFGSKAIRGHGIPEAMEQILVNRSRIPARLTWLKPLSAAISIGTGGPFGAEGPIIATGGAMGSLFGQLIPVSAAERKTLLAAGAAAGMAATFGSPVSAVLLAVELLLFEYRGSSLVVVCFASATATGLRILLEGAHPVFEMPELTVPHAPALVAYAAIGVAVGFCAILITRLVYRIEDGFERLPIHWMWWPALGAVVVGIVGWIVPRTLGVGYDNISDILSARWAWPMILGICGAKLVSWSIALGSGTSGGTLAPLFTIGGGIGAVLGIGLSQILPQFGIDVRVAALVGMAAIFAGASRALLASVVFAFETTRQPMGLLPLLSGCTAAYLVCCLFSRQSIMTEKISRRGILVPSEYSADPLEQVLVRDVASSDVVTLKGDDLLGRVREWLMNATEDAAHQGYPVVAESGVLLGVVTRRDLQNPAHAPERRIADLIRRPPCIVYPDCTVREALDHMVRHDLGRLPVVPRHELGRPIGILTRSDILAAYRSSLVSAHEA